MEKAMVVFCDVVGTYGEVDNSIERKNTVSHFICLLENIRRLNNDDKIIFSFISSVNSSEVKKCLEEITKYDTCNNLSHYRSFYENGYFDIKDNLINECKVNKSLTKAGTMVSYIKSLEKEYQIDKVYFFDDSSHHHMFFKDLSDVYDSNFDIISIIPNSLDSLNDNLEEYIHFNYGNKRKIKILKEATIK